MRTDRGPGLSTEKKGPCTAISVSSCRAVLVKSGSFGVESGAGCPVGTMGARGVDCGLAGRTKRAGKRVAAECGCGCAEARRRIELEFGTFPSREMGGAEKPMREIAAQPERAGGRSVADFN